MDLYRFALKYVTLPLYAMRHGDDTMRRVRDFRKSQWLSADELHRIQLVRMKKLVRQAFLHTRYYRELAKQIGAQPEDIRSFDDFSKIPVLPKSALQERLPDLLADNVPAGDIYRGLTSGSSGQPTEYYQQVSNSNLRHAAGQRLMEMAGHDYGKRIFLIWRAVTDSLDPGQGDRQAKDTRPWPVRLKVALYNKFAIDNPIRRFDPSLLGEAELESMSAEYQSFKPHLIVSYVNSLYQFAHYLADHGGTDIRPEAIVVSSETLYPHQRTLIEEVFGCKVFNRYGLQETGMVAIECPVGSGMHISQEILHLEYEPTVNNDTQIIITDLINHAMPLLRYETGDRGVPDPSPCPCGRGLARIQEIEGRIIELLPTSDGRLVNGQVFATFHSIKGIRQYQVVQKTTSHMRVKLATNSEFKEQNVEPIVTTIRQAFGPDTRVDFEYLEEIPFTRGGKYKLVVSEVAGQSAAKKN